MSRGENRKAQPGLLPSADLRMQHAPGAKAREGAARALSCPQTRVGRGGREGRRGGEGAHGRGVRVTGTGEREESGPLQG